MSGIVRRQPLANGANTTTLNNTAPGDGPNMIDNTETAATIVTSPTNQSNLVGGNLASPANQSGVLSANRISFYPTSPHRQSHAQGQSFYVNRQPQQQYSMPVSTQGQRQTSTSHGRRLNSTHHNNARGSHASHHHGGHGTNNLQNKWARLMHGQSPDQVS